MRSAWLHTARRFAGLFALALIAAPSVWTLLSVSLSLLWNGGVMWALVGAQSQEVFDPAYKAPKKTPWLWSPFFWVPAGLIAIVILLGIGLVAMTIVVDTQVFALYRFHLNGMVMGLLTSGVAGEILPISPGAPPPFPLLPESEFDHLPVPFPSPVSRRFTTSPSRSTKNGYGFLPCARRRSRKDLKKSRTH